MSTDTIILRLLVSGLATLVLCLFLTVVFLSKGLVLLALIPMAGFFFLFSKLGFFEDF